MSKLKSKCPETVLKKSYGIRVPFIFFSWNFSRKTWIGHKNLGFARKALYVSSGTIGGKSFGTNQNFLTFRQWARKCPRNVNSRCGKNALDTRIQKNTLRKMKFSIQKINAEYIIFFWAKTFRTGSAKFHPDYQNWNPRVRKTILKKKFSPEDDVLLVTKFFRKFWPAQKNSRFVMKAFYVSSGTFRGTNFW